MSTFDPLAYTPVTASAISADGRFVAACVRRYDAEEDVQRIDLQLYDGAWRRLNGEGETLFDPQFSYDGRLAALRERAGADVVVLDPETGAELAAPPGMPHGTVALKWWGDPPGLAVIGFDEDNTRRVWVWPDLTRPPVPVTPPRRRVGDYAFAPRSGRVAWVYAPPRSVRPIANALLLGEVGVASHRQLALPESPLGLLSFSPDGRRLALVARPHDEPLTAPRLWVVDLEDGVAVRLLEDRPGWVTGYDWAPDGASLVVALDQGLDGLLLRVDMDGGVTQLGPSGVYLSGPRLDRSRGRMVHLRQAGHEPQHVCLWEPEEEDSRPISTFHHHLDLDRLRPQERLAWTAPDGMELEGLLMRPAGDPPYPLVVWLHGGPAEHIQRTFSPYFQVLAAAGFAVFAPNFRGSTGRDDAFLQALVGGMCAADLPDVEVGVRRLITSGVVHRRRVGLMGWSYGAALALSLGAAHRWVRAIVAGAPVVDWLSVFGATTYPLLTRAYFPGEPWETPEAYDQASPLRRFATLDAPTLLLHGELDDRVPVSQSRLAYHLLLARGVKTDLRLFPGEGHVFAQPWAVRELLDRTVLWLREHLVDDVTGES